MISTHVYTAAVIGTPDTPLALTGGQITLDAGRAPHITATITMKADPVILALLDPRSNPRVRITAASTGPAGAQSRTFDLGVRDRTVQQQSDAATLTLASDEALLDDYRRAVDDPGPLTVQGSLRNIVNYVLGVALPGKSLQATPAVDANMTTTLDAENVLKDPRAQGTFTGAGCTIAKTTSWPPAVNGVAMAAIAMYTPTSSDSYAYLLSPGSMNGFSEGETWVLSATGRVFAAQSGTIHANARKLVAYFDPGGGYVAVSSPALPAAAGSVARVSLEFTIPTGTKEAFIRAYHGATAGEIYWSQFRLSRKSAQPAQDDTEFFWGGKPDTAAYDYSWNGAADASASKRRALVDRKPDVLVWRAGQSALDFLRPLVQVNGLRLVCDEQRRWTLRPETYATPDMIAIRAGVNLVDGSDQISRSSDDWFDAAIFRYRWTSTDGTPQERVDSFASPGATRAVEREIAAAYPGPGRAEYAVRRALQRGREVTATAVADWRAQAEQPITIMLDGAPLQVGTTQTVQFNLDRDEMTVTTRTTDIPAGAIDLLGGTIDALPGTIDSL